MENNKPKEEIKCFIIMPFSDTSHTVNGEVIRIEADEWGYIYENWFKKAVESYPNMTIKCKRSAAAPGNFIKEIITDLYDSRIVIADLTGQKPNVYYELGIRHSLKLGTIMITQDFEHLPSDLKSYYCFKYEYNKHAHKQEVYYKEFEKHLHEKIEYILTNKTSDNPVSDFLGIKDYYDVKNLENEKARLIDRLKGFDFILKESYEIINELILIKDEIINKKSFPFVFIDIDFFNYLFFSVASAGYEEIPPEILNPISTFLFKIRRNFRSVYKFWEGGRNNITDENTEQLFDHCQSLLLLSEKETIKELNKLIQNVKDYKKQDAPTNEHPA